MLVINYYWHPWNTSGSFRWLHLSQYLDFDVLTSKKPNKGFYDDTMPQGHCTKLYRYGYMLPAFLGGLYLSILSVFIRSDKYVYTSPPESILFGAFINQLLGRKVYVDLRDAIDRPTQKSKWLVPIYQWLYKRIKNVCVTMRCFDETKPVIRHGYDDIERQSYSFNDSLIHKNYLMKYREHQIMIMFGAGRDYGEGFEHYTSSSVITLRHLGNPIKGNLHPELFEFEPQSWKEISKDMAKFLGISSESPSCLKRYSECLYQD